MGAVGDVDTVLRDLIPRVVGVLVRRHGYFEECEDAAQDALVDATVQWRRDGVPAHPLGWLLTVASRRMADRARSEAARRTREETVAALAPADTWAVHGPEDQQPADHDDSLTLLFLCCHPSLSPSSQLALTLRACGGLTTAQVAQAFFVPEATMAQRISRAKRRIKEAGALFELPPAEEQASRLAVVLHVLYLIFNEGYTRTSGTDLHDVELTTEAVRLTRALRAALPDDPEVTGLLALMLLTDARRPARTDADGNLIPLAEQDRTRWNQGAVSEGTALITEALAKEQPVGSYRLQAAIAAVHAEAPSADGTDWRQIVILYQLLEQVAPNPMVRLNHAVAAAMADGPLVGLRLLRSLDDDPRIAEHHRLHAVRGHLLETAGDLDAARACYREAARRTASLPERRYLESREAALEERDR
ncbi:RNA polymerase sigma factor [Streptomyces sp. NPDC059788]|uniref:RNA polymerase sigma factor n=1 Tax=Streptomyces sp. NPDC059788 TaxID=3346948 RepID=UPI0036681423